ncbi:MAG: TVP38/TMEM64 family protein [Nitrospirae bacterium]|nr:TVP38/TMEM64 family protein [Nitrospirota bacterium]
MNPKKILLIAVLMLAGVLFFYFDLGRYLALTSLKNNRVMLMDFYEQHRLLMVVIFISVYIAQTAFSLPGAAILSLGAGAVFGTLMGAIYANIGATIGASIAFLVTRYLFHDLIASRFGSRLQKLNQELETRGLNYLLFLRLVPLFPFFLINFGAGLTRMPLRTFFFGTMIGIIPGSIVFCNAGSSLATITDVSQIASPHVLGAFTLLGIFALVPVIYQKIKGTKR